MPTSPVPSYSFASPCFVPFLSTNPLSMGTWSLSVWGETIILLCASVLEITMHGVIISLMVKMCFRVIEMTFLYDADASKGQVYFFLVIKLPTQSVLGQIWLGNGLYQIRENFHHIVVDRFVPEFVFPMRMVP